MINPSPQINLERYRLSPSGHPQVKEKAMMKSVISSALFVATGALSVGCQLEPRCDLDTVYLEAAQIPKRPAAVIKEVRVPVPSPQLRRLSTIQTSSLDDQPSSEETNGPGRSYVRRSTQFNPEVKGNEAEVVSSDPTSELAERLRRRVSQTASVYPIVIAPDLFRITHTARLAGSPARPASPQPAGSSPASPAPAPLRHPAKPPQTASPPHPSGPPARSGCPGPPR